MSPVIVIIVLVFLFSFLILLAKERRKGDVALLAVLLSSGLSSWIAIRALQNRPFEERFHGGAVFGEIFIRADALSGWFILLMNFTMLTGILYGRCYMKAYEKRPADITLHYISYVLNHFAMIGIYCVQHTLVFLCAWEIMTIAAFLLVIFEHEKPETLKAGINYFIQSHISVMLLMLAFIWISSHTGSYDFHAITQYTAHVHPALSFLFFLCVFAGFGIKAGFVPFHTWLPYAHPAAPSHVSGIMSGVLIKLGIYGILRMLLLTKLDYTLAGYTILIISVISGVYGVMLAIIQHNVKKLLAYHSIENIGIIGIGIGLGCLGLGMNNPYLSFAGFSGALLHTLNHSLFKSLLFYTAGTVYQATHTMDIEQLGGLIKKMPRTAALFLIASLAICGLPPFNGFISEFLIYAGLFNGITANPLSSTVVLVSALFGLVLIGGLAMLCFTKAFGIIFLGTARHPYPAPIFEAGFPRLFPQYIVAFFIIFIGLLPQLFISLVTSPVALLARSQTITASSASFVKTLQTVSLTTVAFLLICMAVYWLKWKLTAVRKATVSTTWACGYRTTTPRLQYTANSFVRSYRKLIRPFLMMNKREEEIKDIFPKPVHSQTHPYDKMEAIFIDIPLRSFKRFLGRFNFLQNGSEQFYILYGVVFISIAILLPILIEVALYLLELFKKV
ncbi:MAG TPA: proton-conducting transporter membrane subunit [Puia sp.]